MSRFNELHAAAVAALNEPCENERDQQTHDKLVRFDALYAEGHSKACAVGQVWSDKPCTCINSVGGE